MWYMELDYSSVLLPPSPLAGRIDGSVLRRLILLFFNMVAWSEQRNKEVLVECNRGSRVGGRGGVGRGSMRWSRYQQLGVRLYGKKNTIEYCNVETKEKYI